MCDQSGNTCTQRKKLKCEVYSGSQDNPDVWSIWECIRIKNRSAKKEKDRQQVLHDQFDSDGIK